MVGPRQADARVPLTDCPVDEVLRAVEELEIRGNGEQGRIGFAALDVCELEGLIAHAGIAALAVDDGLKVGRRPNLGHDLDGFVVADLTGGNGVRRADSVDEHAGHGLRAEVFGAVLVVTPRIPLDEKRRWRRPGGRRPAWGTAPLIWMMTGPGPPAAPKPGGRGEAARAFSGRSFRSSSMCRTSAPRGRG